MRKITTYKEFSKKLTFKMRIRTLIRDQIVKGLSLPRKIPTTINWIRFPYYHHIFDDELFSFESQLKYFSNYGDFISIDDAVDMLNSNQPIDGRYFCITFDDGFKNCITNVMPFFLKFKVPVSFYIPTKYIDSHAEKNTELSQLHPDKEIQLYFDDIEFLSWKDCQQIVDAGMNIGSHTVNHVTLSSLSATGSEWELSESKKIIEEKLNIECKHFCAPVGIPDRDFITERDPKIAEECGYSSFLTTRRGSNDRLSQAMFIERDHTLANWSTSQLRYFFSQ